MSQHGEASGDEEAFLRLLVYVNYKSVNVSIPSGKMLICGRGESMMSFAHWERILGWSHGRVRRFFGDCFRLGSLERVNDGCRSHIRIPGYDVWTASASEQTKHEENKSNRHTLFRYPLRPLLYGTRSYHRSYPSRIR